MGEAKPSLNPVGGEWTSLRLSLAAGHNQGFEVKTEDEKEMAEPSLNLVGEEMTRLRLSLAEHTQVLEIITEDDEKIDLSVAGPSPNLGGSEMSRLPEYTNITKNCETVREGEQEKDTECLGVAEPSPKLVGGEMTRLR